MPTQRRISVEDFEYRVGFPSALSNDEQLWREIAEAFDQTGPDFQHQFVILSSFDGAQDDKGGANCLGARHGGEGVAAEPRDQARRHS